MDHAEAKSPSRQRLRQVKPLSLLFFLDPTTKATLLRPTDSTRSVGSFQRHHLIPTEDYDNTPTVGRAFLVTSLVHPYIGSMHQPALKMLSQCTKLAGCAVDDDSDCLLHSSRWRCSQSYRKSDASLEQDGFFAEGTWAELRGWQRTGAGVVVGLEDFLFSAIR